MNQNVSPVILFDGVCNLCNSSVKFIIRFDTKEIFKFGTIQSKQAHEILEHYKNELNSNSVILIENGILYQESTAALQIAKKLKYFWIFYYLIYLPKKIRDPLYKLIAKNRYRWFGKKDKCMVPSEDLSHRFI